MEKYPDRVNDNEKAQIRMVIIRREQKISTDLKDISVSKYAILANDWTWHTS